MLTKSLTVIILSLIIYLIDSSGAALGCEENMKK